MSGFLTSRRIWGCTTFCNHVSGFLYVNLIRDFTVEETILAVKAFEKTLSKADRLVTHYHADNRIFANNSFLESINKKDQKITFCAVGDHHQNRIIENKNKMLTLSGQTLLLHAIRHWPEMIDSMFWPFKMKAAAERHNSLLVNSKNQTPSSVLFNVELEAISVKTFHTLFCLVCVLDSRAQSKGGPSPPKWEPRCRIGVYLGHSPFQARSVALVFNPTTGLVSPQFNFVFDESFSTVPYMNAGTTPPNRDDLVMHYSELSTDKAFELAETGVQIYHQWFRNPIVCLTQRSIVSPILLQLFLIRYLLLGPKLMHH